MLKVNHAHDHLKKDLFQEFSIMGHVFQNFSKKIDEQDNEKKILEHLKAYHFEVYYLKNINKDYENYMLEIGIEDIDEKIELPKEVTNMFREAHVYAKDECRNCWNKFYCSGGCHANAINFNNDIKVPYKLGCEMQKKRTECAIMIQAKMMLEGN